MKGNDEYSGSAERRPQLRARRREVARAHWRSGGLAVLCATAALVLAACGSPADSPHVASLATSSSAAAGTTTASQPDGNATRLVDEWAACERSHGDIHQADPVIDSHGVINITLPGLGQGGAPVGDPHDATGTCSQYLVAAQTALRAADPVQDPGGVTNTAVIIQFASCMRANGVRNYPYPSGPDDSQTNFQGTGVDPDSPAVVRVNDLCGKKLGLPLWWINGWGPPGDISIGQAGLPSNGNPPPCFYAKNPCSGPREAAGNGGSGSHG